MENDLFPKRHRRHIRELNIVPILDMLTTVIFFLLLSTSFMEYTKLTVPPSQTSVLTSSDAAPPLAPKMILTSSGNGLNLLLSWSGDMPGESVQEISFSEKTERRGLLLNSSRRLIQDFAAKFPKEKTLQLGLGPQVPYQDLISVMDGVIETTPDVVLISYSEALARSQARGGI